MITRRAAALALACLASPPAARAFPRACRTYEECGGLSGDCCPDREGVMLSCCVLGAVRMQAERLENASFEAKATATEVSKEARAAESKAQEAADKAKREAEKAAMKEKVITAALKETETNVTKAQRDAIEQAGKATDAAMRMAADAARMTAEAVQLEKEVKILKEAKDQLALQKVAKGKAGDAVQNELKESEKELEEAKMVATALKLEAEKAKERADQLGMKANQSKVELTKKREAAADEEANALFLQRKQEEEVAVQKGKAKTAAAAAAAAQNAADAARAEYVEAAEKIRAAKCENNAACAGHVGFCCPTLVGQELSGPTLGCCTAGGAPALAGVAVPELPPQPPDLGAPERSLEGGHLSDAGGAACLASAALVVAGLALAVGAGRLRGEARADHYVAAAA